MTVGQAAVARRRVPDPAEERIQTEHELAQAVAAARTLVERLDMLGGHPDQRAVAQRIRHELAGELASLQVEP